VRRRIIYGRHTAAHRTGFPFDRPGPIGMQRSSSDERAERPILFDPPVRPTRSSIHSPRHESAGVNTTDRNVFLACGGLNRTGRKNST